MHKLSILCATAILGTAVFLAPEASAHGGWHGGGHHGGWHGGGWGMVAAGTVVGGVAAAGTLADGMAAVTAMVDMAAGADGFLAPMAGIGSGVAGERWDGS
jgi:hypothetical protein